MKVGKNTVTIILIVSSLTLLIVLQALWLSSSYKNEVIDLRKDVNFIFKNTVSQLRERVLLSNLEPSADSAIELIKSSGIHFRKMEKITDTVFVREKSADVQVFLSSGSSGKDDSLMKIALKPFTEKLNLESKNGFQNFSIRIGRDSLNLDTLKQYLKKNLDEAGIYLPVSVYQAKFRQKQFGSIPPVQPPFATDLVEYYIPSISTPLFSDTLKSETARLNPSKHYAASLFNVRSNIFRKITPQILFSIFLTTLTVISFLFLFRSILTQQRLAELKNDFISNMTHELKTPVTTVGVAIEALKNFNGLENKELTQEYLTIAQNELTRLSLLTDKILRTAIFENKGVGFQPETVNLEEIITQVLNSMKLLVEKQKAVVSFEKTGSDFQLPGSHVHLTNVVYNLLDNALKYSRGNPAINISLKEAGKELILIVKDNGVGISPEYSKKVFEKFFRVPTGDVHNSKGYGLGLSYVESVVKAHRGTIVVESEIGRGSCFILKIPRSLRQGRI